MPSDTDKTIEPFTDKMHASEQWMFGGEGSDVHSSPEILVTHVRYLGNPLRNPGETRT